MMARSLNKYTAIVGVLMVLAAPSLAQAQSSSLLRFQDLTEMAVSSTDLQKTWSDLATLGTTKFLGGAIGNFKLDEASMLAGSLVLGSLEFDNFLKSGALPFGQSNLASDLNAAMSSAAGINMSSIVGSHTAGGGNMQGGPTNITQSAMQAANDEPEACDPEVAQALVDAANAHVDQITKAALSEEYGFSKMSSVTTKTGSGFGAKSCLDTLFTNIGVDILFKPPSMDQIMSKVTSWACDEVMSVADQVTGQLPGGFETASLGGFFPVQMQSEAMGDSPGLFPGKSSSKNWNSQRPTQTNPVTISTDFGSLFEG
ncbi:hypothetical protein ACQU0X_26875 [Pseudovibrio ascidiaceicola]|uniref:hypothetical protein n=1 Tax=Pseudovibrio ascidiaceicola TaxID=285279 RepID=UPI003D35AAA6